MYITIINDCNDSNAAGRQQTRVSALFGVQPGFVAVGGGLNAEAEMEAAGNIIDCLDAAGDAEGIILCNVAPRSHAGKQWANGTPFGYFQYKNTLVLSTVAGYTLSLVKKLGLAQEVLAFQYEQVLAEAAAEKLLTDAEAHRIGLTQFRSYEFLPRAAYWLKQGRTLPVLPHAIADIPDAPSVVWAIDNFGNCKTTFLAQDLGTEDYVETKWGKIKKYDRLKDVPNGELGIITGSSGIDDKRFVEIVVQGISVAKKLGITAGDPIGF